LFEHLPQAPGTVDEYRMEVGHPHLPRGVAGRRRVEPVVSTHGEEKGATRPPQGEKGRACCGALNAGRDYKGEKGHIVRAG